MNFPMRRDGPRQNRQPAGAEANDVARKGPASCRA